MVKITFKLASGSKFDMDVEGSMTVATLKDLVSDLANVPPANQRMVFKGQVRHPSD
jgi:ubiquilin